MKTLIGTQVQTTVKTWNEFYATIGKIVRLKNLVPGSIEHRVRPDGSVRVRYRVS